MDPASASAPPDPAAILTMAAGDLAAELGRSLEAAVSKSVRIGEAELSSAEPGELTGRLSGPAAALCLEFGGAVQGRAAVIIEAGTANTLVGLLRNMEGEDLAAKSDAELEDEDLEELGVAIGGSLAGLAEKLGAAVGETPGLGLGDAFRVKEGDPGELLALLGAGPYPVATFELSVEELASGSAMLVFPGSFGELPNPAVEAPAAEPVPEVGELRTGPATGVVETLHPNIQRILRLKLPVSVVVAEKDMNVETVLGLAPGTIVEFNKSADEDLDLRVNHHKIGEGEVVIIGERFGIQLHQIEGLRQRIRKLGAARP